MTNKLKKIYLLMSSLSKTKETVTMKTLANACGYDLSRSISNEVNILINLGHVKKHGKPHSVHTYLTMETNNGN